MEKYPKFERPEPRIVGPGSLEQRAELLKKFKENFGEGHYLQLGEKEGKFRALEYEKRQVDEDLIEAINNVTNEIIEKVGVRPFDIPSENIHILPSAEADTKLAKVDPLSQTAIFNAGKLRGNIMYLASVMLHEFIHFKGYTALQVKDEKLSDVYHFGLNIQSTYKKDVRNKGSYESFRGLNEAVVEELCKRCLGRVLGIQKNSGLRDELKWLASDEALEYKKKIAEKEEIPVEEVFWVSKDGKDSEYFTYWPQRQVLYEIIDAIYEDNKDRFRDKDEVFKVFVSAHFTGRILELGRLIEKAFGRGSFSEVGSITDDRDWKGAWRMAETLKKKRRLLRKYQV